MAQSLRSWLWTFASTQAVDACEGKYDLCDMPFVGGNRVQILRFMTFPAEGQDKTATIWALVGDRTHCIAVRFRHESVAAFERQYAIRLTSLKGALLTLTQIKLAIDRVHTQNQPTPGMPLVQDRGLMYRHLQPSLLLDVAGFRVVSSVSEPVWFTKIHLVTSKTDLCNQDADKADIMLKWMRQWIRTQMRSEQAACKDRKARALDSSFAPARVDISDNIPTPAQRNDGSDTPHESQKRHCEDDAYPQAPAPVRKKKRSEAERRLRKEQAIAAIMATIVD